MSRNKEKPIDRYPYMDNDLKGWANEFVRVETYATGFRYLDNKIDSIIVGSGFVTHDEYDVYTEATDATLTNLQEQIDAIDVSNFVDKDTYNTDKAETDETLENLQTQIDAIDVTAYVEKSTYNTDKEQTDERLDALETIAEGIPTTYATKSELSECCEEVGERLEALETITEDIPNTYATKSELLEYETETDETLESLQTQIDAIDVTAYVEKSTYNTDKEQTDETLESLQTQIDAIDVTAYVEKSTYNTDKEQTDETLESLQTQIDAIDVTAYVEKSTYNTDKTETDETLENLQTQIDAIDTSAYVEKSTYNTDKEQTDGRLDALETIAEDIPNTYATKSELSECCEEVDGRIDTLETTVNEIPNTYATKTELTEYETTTNTALDEIREEIENLDNYDPATDTVLGVVKTNSDKGITLNEDDQLEVDGRMGQFPDGGIYYPTTIEPTKVGNSSLLMSDGAKNLSIAGRTFAILAGANLTCKSAEAGATQYRLSNTQGNRFICFAGQGGNLAIDVDDAKTNGTATITDISFANGNPISAYFGVIESDNDIIITVDRTVNPNAVTTKLRIYGKSDGGDTIVIGQGVGSKGSKAIALGQSSFTGGNQNLALGNSVAVTANNSVGLGHTHLVNKQFCFCAGQGHDFTNGIDGSAAVGIASQITSDTLFAVGNGVHSGSGNIIRSNAFEVRKDGTIITGDRNITQELTDATNNISTLGTQITEVEGDVTSLDTRVTALEQGGASLSDYMGYHYYKVSSSSSYFLFDFELTSVQNNGMSIILNNSCVNVMFMLTMYRNLLPNTTYTLGSFKEWTGISSIQKVTVPMITTSGKLIHLTIDYGQVTLTVGSDEIQSGDEITGTISFANEYPLKTVDENLEQYREY